MFIKHEKQQMLRKPRVLQSESQILNSKDIIGKRTKDLITGYVKRQSFKGRYIVVAFSEM